MVARVGRLGKTWLGEVASTDLEQRIGKMVKTHGKETTGQEEHTWCSADLANVRAAASAGEPAGTGTARPGEKQVCLLKIAGQLLAWSVVINQWEILSQRKDERHLRKGSWGCRLHSTCVYIDTYVIKYKQNKYQEAKQTWLHKFLIIHSDHRNEVFIA